MGQSVAVLSPKYFYIITRDGRKLKLRRGGPMNEFEVKRCNVKSAIIAHAPGYLSKAMLDELQKKFGSNLHVVTNVQKLGDFIRQFWWSFVDENVLNTYALEDYCNFDIEVKGHTRIPTQFKEIPLLMQADVTVTETVLEVNLAKCEDTVELLKTFTLERGTKRVRITVDIASPCDITVTMAELDEWVNADSKVTTTHIKPKDLPELEMKLVADKKNNIEVPFPTSNTTKAKKSGAQRRKQARLNAAQNGTANKLSEPADVPVISTLPNDLSQLELNPTPTTILTFTTDNRVLIESDATYTGNQYILAYVWLRSGKTPQVGKAAFDAMQKYPDSVFYDITRLLAIDFDPTHPDPSWRFKTSRDTDGKVLIHGGDNITTFPIVLFGLVVKSTLLYIKEHIQTDVTELGIRLPSGSVISDADFKGVSEKGQVLSYCTVPPQIGFDKDGRSPSVMYTVNNARGKYFIEAYHSDGSNHAYGFATISDTVAQIKRGSSDPNTPIFFHFTEIATVIEQRRFRDTCREAGFLNVRLISFDTVNLSLLIGSHHINVIPSRFVAVLTAELYYIVTRDGRNLKLHKAGPFEKFRFRLSSVDCVAIPNITNGFEDGALVKIKECLHPIPVHIGTFWTLNDFLPVLLRSHLDETASNRYTFNAFCDFDIDIKGLKLIETRFKEFPLSVSTDVAVSNMTKLEVSLIKSEDSVELLKTFTLKSGTRFVRIVILVKSSCDITATLEPVIRAGSAVAVNGLSKEASPAKVEPTVAVKQLIKKTAQDVLPQPTDTDVVKSKKNRSQRRREGRRNAMMNSTADAQSEPAYVSTKNTSTSTLAIKLSQLELNPTPTTILTFTTDNRVLIKADETYTGDKNVLAYVHLQYGKAPIVGQQAFDALQTNPNSVFYDITRLLATDFNPEHHDPSWPFKTSRDTDGKILIHGGDNITTFPIVLFGLVVKSTLLYIKEHVQSEVTELGIQLPSGSVISDTDLKGVSDKIGTKLVVV